MPLLDQFASSPHRDRATAPVPVFLKNLLNKQLRRLLSVRPHIPRVTNLSQFVWDSPAFSPGSPASWEPLQTWAHWDSWSLYPQMTFPLWGRQHSAAESALVPGKHLMPSLSCGASCLTSLSLRFPSVNENNRITCLTDRSFLVGMGKTCACRYEVPEVLLTCSNGDAVSTQLDAAGATAWWTLQQNPVILQGSLSFCRSRLRNEMGDVRGGDTSTPWCFKGSTNRHRSLQRVLFSFTTLAKLGSDALRLPLGLPHYDSSHPRGQKTSVLGGSANCYVYILGGPEK